MYLFSYFVFCVCLCAGNLGNVCMYLSLEARARKKNSHRAKRWSTVIVVHVAILYANIATAINTGYIEFLLAVKIGGVLGRIEFMRFISVAVDIVEVRQVHCWQFSAEVGALATTAAVTIVQIVVDINGCRLMSRIRRIRCVMHWRYLFVGEIIWRCTVTTLCVQMCWNCVDHVHRWQIRIDWCWWWCKYAWRSTMSQICCKFNSISILPFKKEKNFFKKNCIAKMYIALNLPEEYFAN